MNGSDLTMIYDSGFTIRIPETGENPAGLLHRAYSDCFTKTAIDFLLIVYTIKGSEGNMTNSEIDNLANTIADECIAVRLRILNRVISKIYDDAFRPLGAKVSQMNILVAVGKMGVARPAEVCKALHLDVSTLSRNVERMKARGWLEVIPDEDGRAQPFRLTSTGKKLIERAAPVWKKAQKQSQELLGTAISGQLNQALKRINESAS